MDTKLTLNVGKGIKAPSVFRSSRLSSRWSAIGRGHWITPTNAERTRSFDVGLEQGFWRGRGRVRVSYFRNQFDDLIEFLSKSVLPQLGVPVDAANATPFGAYVNSQSFRAQGVETSGELQARDVRVTASYTYLDTEVLKSFSDGVLSPAINPAFPDTPIGQFSPLIGARRSAGLANTGTLTINYVKDAQVGMAGYFGLASRTTAHS